MILCSDPKKQYLAHKEEIDAAVKRVLESGYYILGQEVRAFEEEFARYIGAEHCVGVGSGTEALHLALAACGIGAGDEVITVSHTAVATVSAILLAGAIPVLVDIREQDFNIDVDQAQAAITSRTKAIIAVHLYGHPAPMAELTALAQRHGLKLIEDCAQAVGAEYTGRKVGTFGDAGCFSFYPTKNLGAIGDGGAVVTRKKDVADKLAALRQYGWKERYVSSSVGWNSRLDEMQAAILRVKLRYLDRDNDRRRELARQYSAWLQVPGLVLPVETGQVRHVYHLYVVRVQGRDEILRRLADAGVAAAVHYPLSVHCQPAFLSCYRGKNLPATERVCKEILSLPMYPELGSDEIKLVARELTTFLEAYAN